MGQLDQDIFVCVDCETTGLDVKKDRIIEVAAIRFNSTQIFDRYESLVNPGCPISEESIAIHHITDKMVADQPKIEDVLPDLLAFIDDHIIIGHGIQFDIDIIACAAERAGIPHTLGKNRLIDTLRMARLYGESPTNSLEQLSRHFNVESEGAHRAMSDVLVNREVFRHLANKYKTTKQLFEVLEKPVMMRKMPLGKHKGRPFREIPLEYLRWAANKDFDRDLLFSIRSELKRRKEGNRFELSGNPFSNL